MEETKKRTLSFSSYSTYVTCAHKYHLEKNERLEPIRQPAHFVFGSAFDKGANALLEGKDKTTGLQEAARELLRIFKEQIVLEERDYDNEIMTDLTQKALIKKLRKNGWKGNDPGELATFLFSAMQLGEKLSKNQVTAVKYLVYFSFIEKISLMLDAYIEYVMPRFKKIVSVQKTVKRGIMDFEAEIKGVPGIAVLDNKTASQDYPEDAVLTSVQLAGYGAEVGAYIVFNKTVRKNRTKECKSCGKDGTGQRHKTCDAEIKGSRCNGEWIVRVTPEVIPQILIDKIPEHNRVMVEKAYTDAEALIDTGIFPKNLTACGKQYGKPCPFIGLCWHNDMTGLKKKKDSK